jgi:hypothetical protein
LPDRVEVGVLGHATTAFPHVDRLAGVPDCVGPPAGEALAARRVVVEVALVALGFRQLPADVRCRSR